MTTKCTGLMGRIFGHKYRNSKIEVVMSEEDRAFLPASLNLPAGLGDVIYGKFVFEFSKKRCQRCGAVTGEKK